MELTDITIEISEAAYVYIYLMNDVPILENHRTERGTFSIRLEPNLWTEITDVALRWELTLDEAIIQMGRITGSLN